MRLLRFCLAAGAMLLPLCGAGALAAGAQGGSTHSNGSTQGGGGARVVRSLSDTVNSVEPSRPPAGERTLRGETERQGPEGGSWSTGKCLLGLSYGTPFKLAAGFAGGFVYEDPNGGADICVFGGAKIGTGAARGSLGIARTIGASGGGAAVSFGLLRTFASPLAAEPRSNWAGVSVHLFPLFVLGGEVGWYRRLGSMSDATSGRTLVTWSAGVGF